MKQVLVFKLNSLNLLVIKKLNNSFFRTTDDSFIISPFNLSSLLKFMLVNNIISPKLIEGVLEEYYNVNNNLGSKERW